MTDIKNATPAELTRTIDGVTIPSPGTFKLDPSHIEIGFAVRHMMVAKVHGRFAKADGTVVIAEDPTNSTVEVTIETASIDTREENRDAHLRSPDFLDVERFPTMTFRSTEVRRAGQGRWNVVGDLTIRDVTKPVALDTTFEGVVQDPYGNQRIGVSAVAEIDREEFGLTWNAALEAGGMVVGRQVKIEIEAEAIRQA
ncbi:MAG: YceI family protein [Actinomycetota bacterium]|nr:YceI family protein [Actinomycetota bacterium]